MKTFFVFRFSEMGTDTVEIVKAKSDKSIKCEDHKKMIVDMLLGISGAHSPFEVYCDWIECMAIGISNASQIRHDEVWQEREDAYKRIMNRYTPEERFKMMDMTALLPLAMEEKVGDILGEIFMECKFGNSAGGQFFTPFHVSELLSELSVSISEDHKTTIPIHEPTCGSGGTIIAAAKSIMKKGVNFQKYMDVVAQDLDWRCVYMCYVQLSLYGIKAIVVQGDTLAQPYTGPGSIPRRNILITPAKAGALI